LIPSLKDLRLVGLGGLILHEAHDVRRLRALRERVEAEGVQRNPVVVSPYGDRYLVLDGAHRVRAIEELGYRLILAQIVEPPERAESWAHLIDGARLRELRRVEGIDVSERPGGHWLAEAESAGGERLFVRASGEGLPAEVRALWGLQEIYPEGVVVSRVDPDGPAVLVDDEAVIRYRPFTPAELVEVVRSGVVLPAGITRFRVEERVLGVSYPLEKMKDGDVTARNAELQEFVGERWRANRIRYYGEPVVLFE
jgi:hypothetical protein